ncbi:2-oxoglutarate-dependent dioxygenase htyE-like [Haliotis rubra]|uniref:2-oxoglutarate-dependent dioxygenase htyE-like n=1 Tax=Haliotis rubra TaxID=36100 RepID=UPI001EE5C976|nr:2-oxoglutarate-dependent dioxygenase htyE-like [Haliotis rubra]
MAEEVPVIDFAAYRLQITDPESVPDSDLKTVADSFYEALSTVGFCYIKNHGLSQDKIDDYFRVSKTFFSQPRDVKDACESPTGRFNGYQALEKERLTPTRPGDLKETFNYSACEDHLNIKYPDNVPGMEAAFSTFFTYVTHLAHRVLDVMSLSLGLQDRYYLRKRHRSLGGKKSPATLRSIYYPPLPDDGSIKHGQLRCGEHTDYGTLALLFQDKIGGLQIRSMDGTFISVPPIEGTVVVNIGDLMQRWTADKLKATVHRVVIPESETIKKQCRQSAVLFVDPDDDVIIDCFDGSGRYSPINSHDFVIGRIKATYEEA